MTINPDGQDIYIVDKDNNVIAWLDLRYYLEEDKDNTEREFQCQMRFYEPDREDPIHHVSIGRYEGSDRKPIFKLNP
tara:strand:+ start:1010 stop:1240 length:231 start_codon:yes stop_codon:yes gene_type:complete